MKREDGYYWIKIKRDEEWQPAQYIVGVWWVIGDETHYENKEIAEVGEKIVKK